jgi:hypothetical protein
MSQGPASEPVLKRRNLMVEQRARVTELWQEARQSFRKLPRWLRLAAMSAVCLVALLFVYELFPGDSTKLRIVCQHGFHSAELTVLVDGKVVCQTSLNGTAKRKFGLLGRSASASGSFSSIVDVPAGRSVVKVHIAAPAERFDETRVISANFLDNQENLLSISSTRSSGLLLNAPAAVADVNVDHGNTQPSRGLLSVVFSVLGTMFSASVSFMVQEFWRSHKNRAATPHQ